MPASIGPKSITKARRVANLQPSATLAITALAKKMQAAGQKVISLAAGEPDWPTPDHVKLAAQEAIRANFTVYTPSEGILPLREAIARKLQADNGLIYTPDQVVVTCGAKHALYNILQVICDEGDEVMFANPYWVSYPEMIRLAGGRPVPVPTQASGHFCMTPEALQHHATDRTRAIILNSPSNPTGGMYDRPALATVAQLAERRGWWVISDEIYEPFTYEGVPHLSIAGLSPGVRERTFTVNGVSKSYCMTGWRIGYVAGPLEWMRTIGDLQSHSTSNPTSISQKAALAALTQDQSGVRRMVEEFDRRRLFLVDQFSHIRHCSAYRPLGAFYLWVDISAFGWPAMDFTRRLLEEAQVAVVPGEAFGDPRCIRISFAASMDDLREACKRIARWAEKQA